MKKPDYGRIILLIQSPEECAEKEKRLLMSKTYNLQAQKIAEFSNNHEAIKGLKVRFIELESYQM